MQPLTALEARIATVEVALAAANSNVSLAEKAGAEAVLRATDAVREKERQIGLLVNEHAAELRRLRSTAEADKVAAVAAAQLHFDELFADADRRLEAAVAAERDRYRPGIVATSSGLKSITGSAATVPSGSGLSLWQQRTSASPSSSTSTASASSIKPMVASASLGASSTASSRAHQNNKEAPEGEVYKAAKAADLLRLQVALGRGGSTQETGEVRPLLLTLYTEL